MTETPNWMELWQEGQKAMLEAQAKAAESFSEAFQKTMTPQEKPAFFSAEAAQSMMAESQRMWLGMMGGLGDHGAPTGFGGGLGNAFGSAPKPDPMAQFKDMWSASLDWPGYMQNQYQAWLKSVSAGPKFADMPNLAALNSKALKEALDYQQASMVFSKLVADGWAKAYSDYVDSYKDQDWSKIDPQKAMDDWVKHANTALLEIQKSEPFLEAQRALLHASLKLKKQQNAQVETWAKQMGMPTRSEVDELIDLVHQLRKEIAELKG